MEERRDTEGKAILGLNAQKGVELAFFYAQRALCAQSAQEA